MFVLLNFSKLTLGNSPRRCICLSLASPISLSQCFFIVLTSSNSLWPQCLHPVSSFPPVPAVCSLLSTVACCNSASLLASWLMCFSSHSYQCREQSFKHSPTQRSFQQMHKISFCFAFSHRRSVGG